MHQGPQQMVLELDYDFNFSYELITQWIHLWHSLIANYFQLIYANISLLFIFKQTFLPKFSLLHYTSLYYILFVTCLALINPEQLLKWMRAVCFNHWHDTGESCHRVIFNKSPGVHLTETLFTVLIFSFYHFSISYYSFLYFIYYHSPNLGMHRLKTITVQYY